MSIVVSVYDNPGVGKAAKPKHTGSGYFKDKAQKSFNPNFTSSNKRKK